MILVCGAPQLISCLKRLPKLPARGALAANQNYAPNALSIVPASLTSNLPGRFDVNRFHHAIVDQQ